MGKFRKGKILVIAILMMIASFFVFTGKVNATTVRRLDYDVHSLLEQADCPSDLNITLIAEGKDITSVFDHNTFMANEPCTKLLLPSTGKFGNFGDYNVTKKVGKNEVKYGIQGWYDNPEFNGDPVDFINFNPKKPVHRTFYAKMAPTTEDLHLDGYDMNGYTVLGKTYDVTAFNRYYTYGYSEDNTEHLLAELSKSSQVVIIADTTLLVVIVIVAGFN